MTLPALLPPDEWAIERRRVEAGPYPDPPSPLERDLRHALAARSADPSGDLEAERWER